MMLELTSEIVTIRLINNGILFIISFVDQNLNMRIKSNNLEILVFFFLPASENKHNKTSHFGSRLSSILRRCSISARRPNDKQSPWA